MVRTSKLVYLVSCLLIVPALACGGGKKSSSSATGGGAQGAAGQTPAAGSPEFAAFSSAFSKVKTFRATISTSAGTGPQVEGSVEVQLPDRYHVTAPNLELINIGSDSYIKAGANWSKSPGGGFASITQIVQLAALATAVPADRITKGGTATVNEAKCQIYTQANSGGSTEFCLASNNLPLRIVVNNGSAKSTIIFTDYDKPLDIKAPI